MVVVHIWCVDESDVVEPPHSQEGSFCPGIKAPVGPWINLHETWAWLGAARVSGTVGVIVGGYRVYFRELSGVCVGLVGLMGVDCDMYCPRTRL